MSVLKTGAWFELPTVQVNVSVSVSVPSVTVIVTLWVPELVVDRVPLMTPVALSIETPSGRPVALYVSVSRSASVASASRLTRVALGVGLVGDVGREDRRLVGVGHGPGERVGIGVGAVGHGDRDAVDAGAGAGQGAADDTGRAVDRDAVGQPGRAVGQRVEVGIGRVGVEADDVALGVGLVGDVGAEDRRLVLVADGPGEGVGVAVDAVGDRDRDVVGARARRGQGAADDTGRAVDRDAVGQPVAL